MSDSATCPNAVARLLRAVNIASNPIFRRYCRARLRPQGLLVSLVITLVIASFVFFLSRTAAMYRGNLAVQDAERVPLVPLLVLQGLILFVLGTGQVAGGMTSEADEGVLEYQRLTPMTPLTKVMGYLFGLPIREYVMFLATLPFTAWALWRGHVAFHVWATLYTALLTSTLLYHLTGLVAGTVVKNRRWAFLISIGVVFLLYTVVPQLARFGLVFFKYLTLEPVFYENLAGILPRDTGDVVRMAQSLFPEARFFNLKFSELVFTVFCQGALILTFITMTWRRWRRAESHLLGKTWAVGLFAWVHVLLLGSALPLIEPGSLFPSRELGRRFLVGRNEAPKVIEAMLMIGLYGLVALGIMAILIGIITPGQDVQTRGLRRARKLGWPRLPRFSDEASSFWFVVVMAVIGAAGWEFFARCMIESRWFPGHKLPALAGCTFALVLLGAGLAFQALLEAWGGRWPFLAFIFIGVVPVMTGSILATASDSLQTASTWLAGVSPISAPVYAAQVLLPAELPAKVSRAVPLAFWFWQGVSALVVVWLITQLWKAHRTRAAMIHHQSVAEE